MRGCKKNFIKKSMWCIFKYIFILPSITSSTHFAVAEFFISFYFIFFSLSLLLCLFASELNKNIINFAAFIFYFKYFQYCPVAVRCRYSVLKAVNLRPSLHASTVTRKLHTKRRFSLLYLNLSNKKTPKIKKAWMKSERKEDFFLFCGLEKKPKIKNQ